MNRNPLPHPSRDRRLLKLLCVGVSLAMGAGSGPLRAAEDRPPNVLFIISDDLTAYIQYEQDASQGIELYDVLADPRQYTNLAAVPEHASVVDDFQRQLAEKLREIRDHDLETIGSER